MTLVGRYSSLAVVDLTETGMAELEYTHFVSDSPADTIRQWYEAGGMISFYDYPLDIQLEVGPHRSLLA